MKYLIDTHVCMWAIADRKKLSARAKDILENKGIGIFVSPISFFEIAIKLKIGKLPDFKPGLPKFIESVSSAGFELLPIKNEHFSAYLNCDFATIHRDPFDRYLIAAAHFEKIGIISKDDKFQMYAKEVKIIW